VAIFACVVLAFPAKDSEKTAESLLTQIYGIENDPSPDSAVVANLKAQVSADITSVENMDETDRITLPNQLEDALQRQHSLEDRLARAIAATNNATRVENVTSERCKQLSLALDAVKVEHDTATAAANQQQVIADRERKQFNASIAAIERDLQILDAVEKKLDTVVEEGSKNAGIAPDPLLHQVAMLVGNMRSELETSQSKASVEWNLTKQRLDLEARPYMERLAATRARVSDAIGALSVCQTNLAEAKAETQRDTEVQSALTTDVEKARAAVIGLQEAFDKRHAAREQRIKFLTDLLAKIQELSEQKL